MAFTVTSLVLATPSGGRATRRIYRGAGPTSYATGGDSFTAADVGLGRIDFAEVVEAFHDGTSVVDARVFDNSDGTYRLRFFGGSAAGAVRGQITAATNLSTYTGSIAFYGPGR